MKPLIPYLLFNGNCRAAMDFYKQCFGGELFSLTYGDSPENACPQGAAKDQIMHATLKKDSFTLMASDWPGGAANQGNNIHLNIDCESIEEIETLFKTLGNEGTVKQALSDTFWGARFGMLVDKFGIHWMLNYPLKK